MTYNVMIDYIIDKHEAKIDSADTLEEAMKKADEWDESQSHFETYIGDITRAFVSDDAGNEWIRSWKDGKILQVKGESND